MTTRQTRDPINLRVQHRFFRQVKQLRIVGQQELADHCAAEHREHFCRTWVSKWSGPASAKDLERHPDRYPEAPFGIYDRLLEACTYVEERAAVANLRHRPHGLRVIVDPTVHEDLDGEHADLTATLLQLQAAAGKAAQANLDRDRAALHAALDDIIRAAAVAQIIDDAAPGSLAAK